MKKKILAISAVLLFVISSVAIGGEWVYRENGTRVYREDGGMMGGLADLLIESERQNRNSLSEGIQSLNQGMESLLDSLKERERRKGMQVIAKMLQRDDISMAELFQVILDYDLDPQITMQTLKPFLATKKVH